MSNVIWLSTFHHGDESTLMEHKQAFCSIGLHDNRGIEQRPIFVAMIGNRMKSVMLRRMFSALGESIPHEPHGQVRLWSSPETRSSECPVVFADCEMHEARESQSRLYQSSGPEIRRQLHLNGETPIRPSQKSLGHQLYAKSLVPFTHVMVMFTSDLGGLQGTSEALAEQMVSRVKDDTPTPAWTRVLLVSPSRNTKFDGFSDAKAIREGVLQSVKKHAHCLEQDAQKILNNFASSFNILSLKANAGIEENLQDFRTALKHEIEAAQKNKILYQRRFSYKHVQAFFGMALDRFASGSNEDLILTRASRLQLGPSEEFSDHLSELLSIVPTESALLRLAAPLLSSALVLDSCPPGMHCRSCFGFA